MMYREPTHNVHPPTNDEAEEAAAKFVEGDFTVSHVLVRWAVSRLLGCRACGSPDPQCSCENDE